MKVKPRSRFSADSAKDATQILLHGLDEQAGGGSGPRVEIFGSHHTHLAKCHSIGLTGLSLGSNNHEVKGKRLFCTDLQPYGGNGCITFKQGETIYLCSFFSFPPSPPATRSFSRSPAATLAFHYQSLRKAMEQDFLKGGIVPLTHDGQFNQQPRQIPDDIPVLLERAVAGGGAPSVGLRISATLAMLQHRKPSSKALGRSCP